MYLNPRNPAGRYEVHGQVAYGDCAVRYLGAFESLQNAWDAVHRGRFSLPLQAAAAAARGW